MIERINALSALVSGMCDELGSLRIFLSSWGSELYCRSRESTCVLLDQWQRALRNKRSGQFHLRWLLPLSIVATILFLYLPDRFLRIHRCTVQRKSAREFRFLGDFLSQWRYHDLGSRSLWWYAIRCDRFKSR